MSPEQRPRPQYGEYADAEESTAGGDAGAAHGALQAESSPEDQPAPTADNPSTPGSPGTGFPTQPPGAPQSATSEHLAQTATSLHAPPSTGNRLPGVPHNLGVAGASSTSASAPAAPPAHGPSGGGPTAGGVSPQNGEPYRASDDPRHPANRATQPYGPQETRQPADRGDATASYGPTSAPVAASTGRNRSADRIITIVLLVLGAYGALNSAYSMMQLRAQVALAGTMFGVDDVVVPAQVGTIGTVGALVLLALYAVVLIYSIQRLRAKKLTFWVPLAAGVLSIIITTAIAMIAFSQSPELLQAMSQPDAMEKLMQYLESQAA